jgi:hypothetical protein
MVRGIPDEDGQATVEVAIVCAIVLIFAVVLGKLVELLGDGTFAAHLSSSASHTATGGILGGAGDVLFF